MKNFLFSSLNQNSISLTVKGAAGFLISIVTVYFTLQGMPDQATNAKEAVTLIADQLTAIAAQIATVVTACITVYGLFRKFIVSFKKPETPVPPQS